MNEKPEEPNTFAKMEEESKNSKDKVPQHSTEQITQKGEIDINNLSDTAVGDRVKYVRPDLDGTEDVIDKFQVFMPDTNEEPRESKSKNSKYWPVTMILTYSSKNKDGVQNREYISGAICFSNKDGQVSQPSFWYDGCAHQSGLLWEKVAASLGIHGEIPSLFSLNP